MKILGLKAIQILDSRATPTVKTYITTSKGTFTGSVPSGASTGKYEALEIRDSGKEFGGKGVLKAVGNVSSSIAKQVIGKEFNSQKEIDDLMLRMDNTENKASLGANSILSVSMAFARAMAVEQNQELYEYLGEITKNKNFVLPVPQLNVINGGRHAGQENDIQEHMLLPIGFDSYSDSLRAGVEVYQIMKKTLHKKFGAIGTLLGDEGGFVPAIDNVEDRLELMLNSIDEAGYKGKIKIGLDSAASEFYKDQKYSIGNKKYSDGELIDFYSELVGKYEVVSIEDAMDEDDWSGWTALTEKIGNKVQLVGDDLLVTNVTRIEKALEEKSCNALLLKINQIGSITESILASELASKNNWNVIVSHRSGETSDSFIADLVVGLGSGQSKFGAPARSERAVKYNRLLEIEEKLGKSSFSKFGGD